MELGREKALRVALVSASLEMQDVLAYGLAGRASASELKKAAGTAMISGRMALRLFREARDLDEMLEPDTTQLLDTLSPCVSLVARLNPGEKDWALHYESLREQIVSYITEYELSKEDLDVGFAGVVSRYQLP